MRILIITGGTTSERRISFMSARHVKKGLEEIGYQVKLYDLKKGPISKNLVKDFDVIFPIIHGEDGEGGKLQQALANFKKPYVGGDPRGFKQGWFKIPFKRFCNKNKIATSPWRIIKKEEDIKNFGFPAVLKSSNGGSSREVVIIKSLRDLKKTNCQNLLLSGFNLFAERYLSGIEITVGVLQNQALPIIEIVPPGGKWFDYKNKYSGKTQEIIGAPSLDEKLKKEIQLIAQNIHRKLNLGLCSRIDFMVSDNKPYVLEVNTIPGFTSESLFPKAAAAIGLSFPALLDKMIKSAYKQSL